MSRTIRVVIMIVIAAIAGLWLVKYAADRWYLVPRRAQIESITKSSNRLTEFRTARNDMTRVQRELQELVNRTLGGDQELVDHKLRSRLNRLAEHAQLQGVSVSTGASRTRESPAKAAFSRATSMRELRDQPDFIELEGSVSGSGSFDGVLKLVDSIQTEPWLKHIDDVAMKPRDNGTRFDVTVRLTTVFLPGRLPDSNTAATTPPDRGSHAYAALLVKAPFRVPPPPPPPTPQPMTDPPPATPTFPYEDWTLTGIAHSPQGQEAWLLNIKSLESRRIAVGERLHEAVFSTANGDSAEFRMGEQRFSVVVGGKMSDRVPISR